MVYDVKESSSDSNELQFMFEELDADGIRKRRFRLDKDEFIEDIKAAIEKLEMGRIEFYGSSIRIFSVRDDGCYYEKSEQSSYKVKLERHSLKVKTNDVYDFFGSLAYDEEFRGKINKLFELYKDRIKEAAKKMDSFDAMNREREEIYKLAEYLYDNYNDLAANNSIVPDPKMSDLEKLKAAYHVICTEDYIRTLIEKKYSGKKSGIAAWQLAGTGVAAMLALTITTAIKLPMAPTTISTVSAALVNLGTASVFSKFLKDDIDIENKLVLKSLENRLYNLYGLEYDKEKDEVVKTKNIECIRH